MVKQSSMPVSAYEEPVMQKHELYKFRTIVSEGSFFLGNHFYATSKYFEII